MVEAYAAAEAWAAEFSSRCEQRIADKIAARGISEPTGNRASGIGEPCERALSNAAAATKETSMRSVL